MRQQTLAEALAERAVLLDGGLSNQLEAQGCDLSDELWSARLLADAPGQIEAAHAAYLRAGAEVLITASYQASFAGFARRGVSRAEAARLLRESVALARRAAGDRAWVAASVGPYGAVLADGSEYRGRYGLSVAELTAFHRPRVAALVEAEPDVLALETVPDATEAEALLRAVEGTDLPVWLSYTVAGGRTRAGQDLADAFAVAAGHPQVIAAGVNCCAPQDVQAAVEVAHAVTGLPAVAYPNSGETWDAPSATWHGGSAYAPEPADGWRKAGARLIGGCCRVGPEQIAALGRRLRAGGD
ncbi:homocysteine S-methyltransferase [Streptomyces sp. A7024]|uniref:Homocysteine S-methyltransferase n=1 Tax=Streptomyces coryli TaxID=1128680 RepID=A0A6G4TY68_9ACTN|nr:homocysteine S-methyltransferase [Streptomyces coryli]NGN64949.1 homocysteine S-methyltransferase [Streptomyces coryli]